ncbi:hypothetical protein BKP37_14075 [Anaerobacillus alkalilacustris]|uniref:Uncharacterized protein n=1 Tax=Anaerobacillus alkalilacustris TaxID=393763 RepID=A0A1S2LJ44_9BACI|nr:hypothetical protein [Anaerobacillus alkalilacustris]OIJ12549.1 hypothetical protein BKP37_14075 [Anaerobacillus alkalilacustris]
MKKKILAVFVLLLVVVIAGCNGSEEQDRVETEPLTFSKDAFNISLLDTSENFVNINPEGKTIYAYFTGVG